MQAENRGLVSRFRPTGWVVRALAIAILATGAVARAPHLGFAQSLESPATQTTSWVQISESFLTSAWSTEGQPAAADPMNAMNAIQSSGWLDSPRYPPENRGAGLAGEDTSTAGQSVSEPTYVDGIYAIKKDYIYSWGENSWRILTGPLRYEKDDWVNVAITLGVTGSLFLVDKAFNDFWQDDARGDSLDEVLDTVTEFGDFQNITFGTIGAYAAAEALGAKREKAAALMILESVVLTTALTEGTKFVTGRERPKDAKNAFDFNGITSDSSQDSLPSGHASNAFAVATVLSEVYGNDNPWVPWVAYPIAGAVGLSRINKEKHFLSDVFLGSAIGFFVGKMVTRYNPFLEENGIEVKPFGQQGAQGISLAYKF